MLKRIYSLLNIAIVTILALNVGNAALTVYDYMTNPVHYEMMSAPWYLGIELGILFSLIVLIPLLIIRFIIGRKLKNKK